MAEAKQRSNILVTGGNGAIGQFVIDELLEEGHRVVSLSRHAGRDRIATSFTHVGGDIRDLPRLQRAIDEHRVNRVIHLAGLLLECEADPHLAFEINSLGTVNVLEAARRTGVRRTVFVSTKAALGPLSAPWGYPSYQPIAEDHPRAPVGMYGLTKKIAEDMAFAYRSRFGMNVVTIRFGTSCGPGKGARHGASAITSTMIENAVKGIPTSIPQGADEKDDIIYNRDVAHGIVLAALTEGLEEPIYHLGTGVLITLEDLASAIRSEIADAQIAIGPGCDYMGLGLGNYCLMSTELARRDLGFAPRYSLARWVKEYIAIMRGGAV
jgi:UDP-glucose 4-epimerase